MSDETTRLEGIIERLRKSRDELADDNARLRALVKEAEWAGDANGDPACPWCPNLRALDKEHHKTCPAFTPEGEVR